MTVLSEQDRKRLMQWVLDRGDARGLGDLVEAIVARHVAEAWPCDNFTRPVTCIGAKVSETARCSFCAAALAEAEQKGAREALLAAADVVAGMRAARARGNNQRLNFSKGADAAFALAEKTLRVRADEVQP